MKNDLLTKFTLDVYQVSQTVLNWTTTEAKKNCGGEVAGYSWKPARVNLPYCQVLLFDWRHLGPYWCGSFRRIPKRHVIYTACIPELLEMQESCPHTRPLSSSPKARLTSCNDGVLSHFQISSSSIPVLPLRILLYVFHKGQVFGESQNY